MPNINLLQTISTATTSSYFVVTDAGLARRYKVFNLVNDIAGSIVGPARTDQDLYKSSSVRFNSVSLTDSLTTSTTPEHGFTTDYVHMDGANIRLNDVIGTVRFGGYDGTHQIIRDKNLAAFIFGASALEDWQSDGDITTNAGTSWAIAAQPLGVRLTESSRQKMIVGRFIHNPSVGQPPIAQVTIGSGIDGAVPQLVSADGNSTYNGFGKTEFSFIHANVNQFGVTSYFDGPKENNTLDPTNVYKFHASRYSAVQTRRQPLHAEDDIGVLEFRGTDITETVNNYDNSGAWGATITARAEENFTTSTHGTRLVFDTAPAGTNFAPTHRLILSDRINTYHSNVHSFHDESVGEVLSISSTTTHVKTNITFADNSVQTTAYPGTRTVSVPANSSSSGVVGDIAYDSTYVYLCVDTNTWRRMLASTF